MEAKMNAICEHARESRGMASADPVWAVHIIRRCWQAVVNWQLEHAAFAQLSAMSDRQLRDMGLARSEIGPAVQGELECVNRARS